jgi:antitoxin ParD1/3/4
MKGSANKRFSVTLGALSERAEERVKSGEYLSISEVVRAGLCALEREEAAFDAVLKAKVQEALADPRPPISAEEMKRHMEELYANSIARDG